MSQVSLKSLVAFIKSNKICSQNIASLRLYLQVQLLLYMSVYTCMYLVQQ